MEKATVAHKREDAAAFGWLLLSPSYLQAVLFFLPSFFGVLLSPFVFWCGAALVGVVLVVLFSSWVVLPSLSSSFARQKQRAKGKGKGPGQR